MFLGLLAVALVALAINAALGVRTLLLPFFAHLGIGLAVTGLVVGFFRFPMDNVVTNNLPSLLAISVFGISDFIWGGQLFGRDLLAPAAFLTMGVIGFLIISHFGRRSRS
jgi:hypothetical protein